MKYTDPDGRADVYSYKYSDNSYGFSTDVSTIEGGIKSLYGLIPFVGGTIYEGINRTFGFRTIDKNDGYSRLMSVASPILDGASSLDTISKIARLTGSVAKAAGVISKVAGVISYIAVGVDVIYNLSQSEEVSANLLVDRLFGGSLTSTSHENVAALYTYARQRVNEMISDGSISYKADKDGFVTGYSYDSEVVKQVKDELKVIKSFLED